MDRAWLFSVLGLVGFLLLSWALLTYGLPLVMPFVVALLIAELMEPTVRWLVRRARMPRTLAVAVSLVVVIGVLVALFTVGIAYLVGEIRTLISNLPYLYAAGLDFSVQLLAQLEELVGNLPETMQVQINENLGKLQSTLVGYLESLAKNLGFVTSVPGFLINVVITFVATFFIARDREAIGKFLLSLFPVKWRDQLRQVKTKVWTDAIGWAKAQVLLILMTMLVSMLGLAIIGANYVALAGLAIGILDVLPIVGPGAIYVPWAIYAALTGRFWFGVKLLILYAAVSAARQAAESKVVGDRVGLHPLAVLLSIYLGIKFFGALGVLFGPLITILLKAMITSGLLPIFTDDSRKI
ncbi:MAG: sporulation integral membrane protein YtvI [Symbiobacterium sp.]|uniref:sporulation integral membrane protein YtvI n=1 Tax=Symbiobacterium sp. TaxID=1971213 RepID=UPI003464176C